LPRWPLPSNDFVSFRGRCLATGLYPKICNIVVCYEKKKHAALLHQTCETAWMDLVYPEFILTLPWFKRDLIYRINHTPVSEMRMFSKQTLPSVRPPVWVVQSMSDQLLFLEGPSKRSFRIIPINPTSCSMAWAFFPCLKTHLSPPSGRPVPLAAVCYVTHCSKLTNTNVATWLRWKYYTPLFPWPCILRTARQWCRKCLLFKVKCDVNIQSNKQRFK
jgi:hypothetical protein